ncbi:HlyD family efflux transporter periplasmic adaptor subunit [Caulobacter segnis]
MTPNAPPPKPRSARLEADSRSRRAAGEKGLLRARPGWIEVKAALDTARRQRRRRGPPQGRRDPGGAAGRGRRGPFRGRLDLARPWPPPRAAWTRSARARPGGVRGLQDVFYQPGGWAAADQPVVALLSDGRVRLRFFVPEAEVARYRPGAAVRFTCDGCGAERTARINYVSPRSEFTPPVIYSREARQRLVLPGRSPARSGARPWRWASRSTSSRRRAAMGTRSDRPGGGRPRTEQVVRSAPRGAGRLDPGRQRADPPASSGPTAPARPPRCGCCAAC